MGPGDGIQILKDLPMVREMKGEQERGYEWGRGGKSKHACLDPYVDLRGNVSVMMKHLCPCIKICVRCVMRYTWWEKHNIWASWETRQIEFLLSCRPHKLVPYPDLLFVVEYVGDSLYRDPELAHEIANISLRFSNSDLCPPPAQRTMLGWSLMATPLSSLDKQIIFLSPVINMLPGLSCTQKYNTEKLVFHMKIRFLDPVCWDKEYPWH